MLLLHDQDRENTYNYEGQKLYTVPVLSPEGKIWGFNLHMEGAEELLGTFDTLDAIMYEMECIRTTDLPEWFVTGFSDYNGESDWNMLCECMKEMD